MARPVDEFFVQHRRLRKPFARDQSDYKRDWRDERERQRKTNTLHAQLTRQTPNIVAQAGAQNLQQSGQQIGTPAIFEGYWTAGRCGRACWRLE